MIYWYEEDLKCCSVKEGITPSTSLQLYEPVSSFLLPLPAGFSVGVEISLRETGISFYYQQEPVEMTAVGGHRVEILKRARSFQNIVALIVILAGENRSGIPPRGVSRLLQGSGKHVFTIVIYHFAQLTRCIVEIPPFPKHLSCCVRHLFYYNKT